MKPPAFQFYARDFLVSCAMMSAEEVGAYIRLLCYQWEHGSLPDDDEQLCRLGGCSGNAVASIRHKFSIASEGKVANKRLEIVRGERDAFSKKQSEKALSRWKSCKSNAAALPEHMPEHMPDTMPESCSASASAIREEKIETPTPKARKPKTAKTPAQTDDEWIDGLCALPENQGINVRHEFTRMHDWCAKKCETPSRRRFINWLGRADRPLKKPAQDPNLPNLPYSPPNFIDLSKTGGVFNPNFPYHLV